MTDATLTTQIVKLFATTKGRTLGRRALLEGISLILGNVPQDDLKIAGVVKFLDDAVLAATQIKTALMAAAIKNAETTEGAVEAVTGEKMSEEDFLAAFNGNEEEAPEAPEEPQDDTEDTEDN